MGHFILGVIALIAAIFIWNEFLAAPVVQYAERRVGKRAANLAQAIVFLCAMLQWVEAIALIVFMAPFFAFIWTLETARTRLGRSRNDASPAIDQFVPDRSHFA